MKLFHNFDTELKQKDYRGAINRVGKNKVILVERSFYYWLLKGLIPLLLCIIINIWVFILFIYLLDKGFTSFAWFIIFIWLFVLLWWLIRIMNYYINYKLDFSIITSEEIITHSQKGFFKRNYKNMPSSKIRSIQSQHSGVWGNLLNYGSITLLIDGGMWAIGDAADGSGSGKIIFTYVYKPNFTRREIMDLCVHNKTLDDECMINEKLKEKKLWEVGEKNKKNTPSTSEPKKDTKKDIKNS